VPHAEKLVGEFNRRHLKAEIDTTHINGGFDPHRREKTLKDFETGKLRILINCKLLQEGYDLPRVRKELSGFVVQS
jgi:superfamily II DNA or RNA helicase